MSQVIDDCLSGKVSAHYQTGHSHAYLNVMYMGEVSVCKILVDPMGKISEFKSRTKPYPQTLKDAIVQYFMFEASFSLMLAGIMSIKMIFIMYVDIVSEVFPA